MARKAGLTGKSAPHSLRYARAVDAMAFHTRSGMSEKEVSAMVSMDLGHGDGRYVVSVYTKSSESGI